MFKRKIYSKMQEWKKDSDGKTALLIEGARRIGKSTVVEEFAKNEYESYILIDFARASKETKELFEDVSDLNFLFLQLQLQYRVDLQERKSVIIFDEVQLCPAARQAIKALVADHRYDYIETGSLISIKKNVKDILIPSEERKISMYPMDYEEFLWAIGDTATFPLLKKCFEMNQGLGDAINRKQLRQFRLYMLVGGMPQAVSTYIETNNFRKVDEDLLEELEEALIMSDVGMETSMKIIENLRDKIKTDKIEDADLVKQALREQIEEILDSVDSDLKLETKPSVILFVGVNGVGKTTSIGKIANNLRKEGKKVIVAAADTFRAAAVEQLEVWANRAQVQLVKRPEGTDPASVVFDAIKTTKQENADVLIIDTAGRLHNKKYLMDELIKINKVIDKELPDVSKEVLMVLDATTGQNAIMQVKAFKEAVNINGLVLTKLDGTSKGGAVIGIVSENNLPIKFIGVGEQLDDMQKFNSADFVNSII